LKNFGFFFQKNKLGQNWLGPMEKLIILPLHVETNSACSSLDEEEGGDARRRTT
jgi:hypothetical protein